MFKQITFSFTMPRFLFGLFCLVFFSLSVAAETSEQLYLKLLLKKENELSELREQIAQLQKDVAQLLGRENYAPSRRVGEFEQKASPRPVNQSAMFHEEGYTHPNQSKNYQDNINASSISWNESSFSPSRPKIVTAPFVKDSSSLLSPPLLREGFSIEAGAFNARLHRDSGPWALKVKNDSGDQLQKSYKRKNALDPGYFIGLIYEDGLGWDGVLRYRFLESSEKDDVNITGSDTAIRLKPVFTGGFEKANEDAGNSKYKTASLDYDFEMHEVSFSIGRDFIFDSGLHLIPRGGVRAVFLTQKEEAEFAVTGSAGGFSSLDKESFKGAGPYLGFGAHYPIWKNLFIFDKAEAGYYMGQYRHDLKSSFDGKTHPYKRSNLEAIPHFINEIGVGWHKAWNKSRGFTFELSYFFENWGNFNQRAHYDIQKEGEDALKPAYITKKNLFMDGIKASLKGHW